MRICLPCHDALACENQHARVILRSPAVGDPCGICGGDVTEVDCYCAAAREINSFNLAVKTMALAMRRKFIENMDKGGWAEIDWGFGIKRLNHEVGELAEACVVPIKGPRDWQAIVDESADVANFAVFLATRAMHEDSVHRSIMKRTDEALAAQKAEEKKA
jgi:NTP pyrophosphatase (non-canonical NTP hydrolase)